MSDDWIREHIGDLEPRAIYQHSLLSIYEAVDDYRTNFLHGRRSTNNLYRAYQVQNPDRPSLNTILRIAPLDALLQEVERPGWEERVPQTVDPREPTPEQLAQREHARLHKRVMTGKPQRVLQVIEDTGEATARQIATQLELSLHSVRNHLTTLRNAGLIYPTQPITSSRQSYIPARETLLTNGVNDADPTQELAGPFVATPPQTPPAERASAPVLSNGTTDWIRLFLDAHPERRAQVKQSPERTHAIRDASESVVAEICALLTYGTPTAGLRRSLAALSHLLDDDLPNNPCSDG